MYRQKSSCTVDHACSRRAAPLVHQQPGASSRGGLASLQSLWGSLGLQSSRKRKLQLQALHTLANHFKHLYSHTLSTFASRNRGGLCHPRVLTWEGFATPTVRGIGVLAIPGPLSNTPCSLKTSYALYTFTQGSSTPCRCGQNQHQCQSTTAWKENVVCTHVGKEKDRQDVVALTFNSSPWESEAG